MCGWEGGGKRESVCVCVCGGGGVGRWRSVCVGGWVGRWRKESVCVCVGGKVEERECVCGWEGGGKRVIINIAECDKSIHTCE